MRVQENNHSFYHISFNELSLRKEKGNGVEMNSEEHSILHSRPGQQD